MYLVLLARPSSQWSEDMNSRDKMVTRAFLLQVKVRVGVFGIPHNAALGSLQIWCSLKELMEVACADHGTARWSLAWKKAVFSKKLPNTKEKKIKKLLQLFGSCYFLKQIQSATQITDKYNFHIHTNSRGSQGSRRSHWGSHQRQIPGYKGRHLPSN